MNVKALIKPVAVLAAVFVLLLALSAGLAPTAAENAAAEQARLFDTLLPGGAPFTEEAYNGEDTAIAAVHRVYCRDRHRRLRRRYHHAGGRGL